MNLEQLTFWSEELPAKPSAWQDSEKDSPIPGETLPSPSLQWLITLSPNGLSGKTSPVFCQAMEDGTLVPSSGRWGNSGMGGPTESLTLSTQERVTCIGSDKDGIRCHNVAGGSSLSHTLQAIQDVHPKYYLSPKACAGILRRAEKRGKALPPVLEKALLAVVAGGTEGK